MAEIIVCGSGPLYTVATPRGRKVRFTVHDFLGPTFWRADGDTIVQRPMPHQWAAFDAWWAARDALASAKERT